MADILQIARECGALDAGTSQLGERVFLVGEHALAAFADRIRAEAMRQSATTAAIQSKSRQGSAVLKENVLASDFGVPERYNEEALRFAEYLLSMEKTK